MCQVDMDAPSREWDPRRSFPHAFSRGTVLQVMDHAMSQPGVSLGYSGS
jgi:hypothetical protein